MNNKEIRSTFGKVERKLEEGEESRKVEGYAAMFDKRSANLGWFEEEIQKGAFDEVLNDDVRCLFNHNPSLLLARTKSNTLKIWVDEIGLKYSFEAPQTRAGDDLLESLKRGDVDQSSFSFQIKDATWEKETRDGETIHVRKISKIKRLFDVSPVTYPAYPDTSVAKRSFEQLEQDNQPITTELLKYRIKILKLQ